MSYADVAARIGAIESNLARVAGFPTPAAPETRSAATAGNVLGGSLQGTANAAANSTNAGITFDSPAGTEFQQVLQNALDASANGAAPAAAGAGPAREAERGQREAVGKTAATTRAQGASEPAAAGGIDGARVVAASKKYLGVPYVWGGNNPKVGLDCSSFVQHTFRDLGIQLPRVARQQAKEGTEVPSLAQARPGDLIVTRGGGHIGIYLGGNKMIHAPRPGESVSIRELFETDKDIMTIRRIVPSEAAANSGPADARAAQRALFDSARAASR